MREYRAIGDFCSIGRLGCSAGLGFVLITGCYDAEVGDGRGSGSEAVDAVLTEGQIGGTTGVGTGSSGMMETHAGNSVTTSTEGTGETLGAGSSTDTVTSTESSSGPGSTSETEEGTTTEEGDDPPCETMRLEGDIQLGLASDSSQLAGVTHLEGNLSIDGTTPAMLEDLACLRAISGSLTVASIPSGVDAGPLLGLRNLENIGENLTIQASDVIEDLDWLHRLRTIGRSLSISYLPRLRDVSGLSGLQLVDRDIEFKALEALETFGTWDGVEGLGGDLYFKDLPELEVIALPNLAYVWRFTLLSVGKLQDLRGFTSLTSVSYTFSIAGNPRLMTLDGLQGLGRAAEINIWGNPILYDISGGHNINADKSEVPPTQIYSNASLDQCNALAFVETVVLPMEEWGNHQTNLVRIQDNKENADCPDHPERP